MFPVRKIQFTHNYLQQCRWQRVTECQTLFQTAVSQSSCSQSFLFPPLTIHAELMKHQEVISFPLNSPEYHFIQQASASCCHIVPLETNASCYLLYADLKETVGTSSEVPSPQISFSTHGALHCSCFWDEIGPSAGSRAKLVNHTPTRRPFC